MHLFDEDKLRGVAYYRFSAEDKQENSIENQREALIKKAAAEEVQIIDSFEDEGVSGLTFERPDFQRMLDKYVYDPNAPKIDYILFYDASRFGRVQRMSQVWRLIGELEDKDIRLGSVDRGIPRGAVTVVDTILMTLDFAMSSEYSRLLSGKVILGSMKVAEQGFSAGGCPPYGYVRILLDEQHNRKRILPPGVTKEVSNERVSFEPSTDGAADVVGRIFHEFISLNYFPTDIADRLNEEGLRTAKGRAWNASGIIKILTNQTYAGTRVYNKTWSRLKEKRRPNPPEEWVRCLNAHEALVDMDIFFKAQERLYWLRPRSRNRSIRKIHAVQSYMSKYVEEVIADFSDDKKYYIRRYAPISFGANYIINDAERTCFHLPPHKTKYGEFLLCAIDLQSEESGLQAIYKHNSSDLKNTSYLVIGDDAPFIPLERQQIKGTIQALVDRVVDYHAPWLQNTNI